MSKSSEDFQLERWEEWMKEWLLDPSISILDESEFHMDLYDTTESLIVEVDTELFLPEEMILRREENELTIELNGKDEEKMRKRKIKFPFSLLKRPITFKFLHHSIEISIPKKTSPCTTPAVMRVQGQCQEDRYK
jgi:HSP20 family molecular chaperone IbpA